MNSTPGRAGFMAMWCTQCPTSAVGSGMYFEYSPLLIGFQVAPPSSVRNAPAAEIAMYMRCALVGSRMIVCRHMPPAPGCHFGPVPCPRSPESSCQFLPPSVERNSAASSTPAYTVSGSLSEGSRCHTRLNSQGCGDPSYQVWVPGVPSYWNWLPTVSHVFPASFDRCITWPNQALDCDAYSRFGSAGEPLT